MHDSPLKRKRTRLERTDSDGVFSFFRRKFYRNTVPEIDDENNNGTEHDDESNPEECFPGDYSVRGLRRVTAMGVEERANDVLLRVARTAVATANVVFFPGDVQDFHSSMRSGSYAEYESFSYEHTAELLAAKFGDAANVWIVRPSRFQYGALACFDGFVDTNKVGAVASYTSNGSAVEQLVGLMESVHEILEHDAGEQEKVRISTLLPVHLVGFSKGGVVLNQIATEIATRWHASSPRTTEEEDVDVDHHHHHNNNSPTASHTPGHHADSDPPTERETPHASLCRQFASSVASIHWLDSGNGAQHGAVPICHRTLVGLGAIRSLQLCVHVTPYQFDSNERPWIQSEVRHVVTTLQRLGANVKLLQYCENEMPTLASHFQILHDFQVPGTVVQGKEVGKTGQMHSPEVTLTPVAIQTRRERMGNP